LPRISIITPVYNGMPFLTQCIASVLAQDFEEWELLISDDASNDESWNVISSLSDARIRIFRQHKNLGIFGNMNFLFSNARSPISQILCQDDYFISRDSLRHIVDLWGSLGVGVGIVRCNWGEGFKGIPLRELSLEVLPGYISPRISDLSFFLFGCIPGNLSNVSLRTSIVEECGWFSQCFPYAGDFEFWIRACRKNTMLLEKRNWVFVRDHIGQASNHLNAKGELVIQLARINYQLLRVLWGSHALFLLKLHTTVNLDALHCRIGLRRAMNGDGGKYMESVRLGNEKYPRAFKGEFRIVCFSASLFGLIGTTVAARLLLKRYGTIIGNGDDFATPGFEPIIIRILTTFRENTNDVAERKEHEAIGRRAEF
jgi:glycosyltransferase involved in cell wall biosynthesis